MAKIFISHSTKNRELVESFLEFLQLGMGVDRSDIFCTSYHGELKTGEDFVETIRSQLQGCEVVISLITEEYLASNFCMIELGAAWGMSKAFFPLLSVPIERLRNTPLIGLQLRNLKKEEDLSAVYDELGRCKVRKECQTAEFTKHMPKFVSKVRQLLEGDYQILKDRNGYYEAVVKKVRWVGESYRCYGIEGHIENPPDGQEAGSDWVFFRKGMYCELQPGDRVRFRISKTEVMEFSDLGRARNIYPAELWKENEK